MPDQPRYDTPALRRAHAASLRPAPARAKPDTAAPAASRNEAVPEAGAKTAAEPATGRDFAAGQARKPFPKRGPRPHPAAAAPNKVQPRKRPCGADAATQEGEVQTATSDRKRPAAACAPSSQTCHRQHRSSPTATPSWLLALPASALPAATLPAAPVSTAVALPAQPASPRRRQPRRAAADRQGLPARLGAASQVRRQGRSPLNEEPRSRPNSFLL